jgi:hypothetical protein
LEGSPVEKSISCRSPTPSPILAHHPVLLRERCRNRVPGDSREPSCEEPGPSPGVAVLSAAAQMVVLPIDDEPQAPRSGLADGDQDLAVTPVGVAHVEAQQHAGA